MADGHWSRDPIFAVNLRVTPTPPRPVEPADIEPTSLLGAPLELAPEQFEELRALGDGIDEWLRQDERNVSTFLEDPNAGIEAAVAAGCVARPSDDLRKAFEEALKDAEPRPVRAGVEVATTVLPFPQEPDHGKP